MRERWVLLVLLLATGAAVFRGSAPGQGTQAEGKVIEVVGDRVKIALEKGGPAKVGFQVEISSPTAELAGFWLVTEVRGNDVTAVKVEAVSAPRVGWKARVYDADAVAQAPDTPPPWEADKPAEADPPEHADPPIDYEKIFDPPPPGAYVSTKGYMVRLPDGRFQEGFDNFRRWVASRGPSREKMTQAYKKWQDAPGNDPFLGLWVEKNDYVMSQIYAMAPGGLVVLGVCPGAAAEKAGLQTGDIILKIDREFVSDPLVFSETAGKLALEVERDSKLLKITLEAEHHEY